jgi:hypothetical protein
VHYLTQLAITSSPIGIIWLARIASFSDSNLANLPNFFAKSLVMRILPLAYELMLSGKLFRQPESFVLLDE